MKKAIKNKKPENVTKISDLCYAVGGRLDNYNNLEGPYVVYVEFDVRNENNPKSKTTWTLNVRLCFEQNVATIPGHLLPSMLWAIHELQKSVPLFIQKIEHETFIRRREYNRQIETNNE